MPVMACETCKNPRDVGDSQARLIARGERQNRCAGCATAARGPRCRHCGTNKATRPRGLCWACHTDVAVRNLYPSGGAASEADFCGYAPLPDAPKSAAPGTREKLEVMAARAAARVRLHHPLDEKRMDGTLPSELLPMPHERRATA